MVVNAEGTTEVPPMSVSVMSERAVVLSESPQVLWDRTLGVPGAKWSVWSKRLNCQSDLAVRLQSRLGARLLSPILNGLRWVASSDWLFDLPQDVVTESVSTFDERFDRLWQSVSGRFEMIEERSACFLSSRFRNGESAIYSTMALVERTSRELIGYVVWRQSNKTVFVADFLATDDALAVLLLAEFSRQMRRGRVHTVEILAAIPVDFAPSLDAAGFRKSPTRDFMASATRLPNVEEHLRADLPERLFATLADAGDDGR